MTNQSERAWTLSTNFLRPSNRDLLKECYRELNFNESLYNSSTHCPVIWDGMLCWNATLRGTTALNKCPSKKGFEPTMLASKVCTSEALWWKSPTSGRHWSNYTLCVDFPKLQKDMLYAMLYIIGYSISIVFLTISIVIFLSYRRQLNSDRVRIHRHLFSCNLFNCIICLIGMSLHISPINTYIIKTSPVYCQGLHIFLQYAAISNSAWMFCEGFYLHSVIVYAFVSRQRLLLVCYITGWVVPLFPTIVYILLRSLSGQTEQCWFPMSEYTYIIKVFIVFPIVANFIILLSIIRVLLTKLRAVQSPDACQFRKAFKATIILAPLLGIQFCLFPFEPTNNQFLRDSYIATNALISSLQGLFLSLIFCFFNKEVFNLMRRKYTEVFHQRSQRRQSSLHATQLATLVTYPTNNDEANKHKTAYLPAISKSNESKNKKPSYEELSLQNIESEAMSIMGGEGKRYRKYNENVNESETKDNNDDNSNSINNK